MKNIKVKTVEQFHVLTWIKENFNIESLSSIDIVSQNALKITDSDCKCMLVSFDKKINYEFV